MSRLFAGTQFDQPKRCEKCGKLPVDCRCMDLPEKKKMSAGGVKLSTGLVLSPENSTPPKEQVARVRIEKRKGNRTVTLVTGLDHPANDLPKLVAEIRQTLSVGGSVQGRTIEVQGDQAGKIVEILTARGMRARQA